MSVIFKLDSLQNSQLYMGDITIASEICYDLDLGWYSANLAQRTVYSLWATANPLKGQLAKGMKDLKVEKKKQ